MTVFGCIADDFTGATDIAGLLARSGVRVRLHTGLPASEPDKDAAAFEVIALKIRTSPVAEAVSEARAALDWLRGAGATRFFWKYCSTFDSTEQGNIGPVAEALMADLGINHTIYCPAFPENGRRVFMGNLFVHQQPLAESPMKDHPLTPMRDSNLQRLLAPQVSGDVALADLTYVAQGPAVLRRQIESLFEKGSRHVVADAIDNGNLRDIAEACADLKLLTGGSALAMALPALYLQQGILSADAEKRSIPSLSSKAVVLSGSASAMTNMQVADYLARGVEALQLDPLDLAENGHGAALEWLSKQELERAPLVYATARPDRVREVQARLGVERAGAIVEEALAALAVYARDLGAGRIVVAGGETSGAVTRALGVSHMDIGPEIAAGVPWCFCVSNGKQIGLTLKSGNFGRETFFADALRMLAGETQ